MVECGSRCSSKCRVNALLLVDVVRHKRSVRVEMTTRTEVTSIATMNVSVLCREDGMKPRRQCHRRRFRCLRRLRRLDCDERTLVPS